MAFAILLAPPNRLHHSLQIPNGGRIPLPKLSNPTFNSMSRNFHLHRLISTSPRNCASIPSPNSDASDDFISRVLRENPSQVEPRHLVGNRFYTLREMENFNKASDGGIVQLVKNLYERWGIKLNGDAVGVRKGELFRPVYLKEMLREFRGKLYVPEEVFREDLSEEEEFDRNLRELPKMSYEDFQKAVRSDKVKLLTSKSLSALESEYAYHDFIVDLKEIPGDKQSHRTKW
ncbi:hypothetical protein ACLOJK_010259 [Asimina triloba]